MPNTSYASRVTLAIRSGMAVAGITILGLSQVTGIPRTTLDRRLSTGGGSLQLSELEAIAEALGTSPEALTQERAA